ALDTWYHLAWRYTKSSDEQAVFLNGVLDGSATGKGSFAGSGPVWIGRFPDQDWFFPGQIAELRIWRTARSAAEIRAAMHQRLAGDEPGLAGVWPLDDGEGETAANAGAALAGRNFGATSVTPSPPPATAIPEALELNGTSSYLEIPHHGDLAFARPDDDFTLELWVQAGDQAGDEDERVVVEKWKGGGGFPWALRYRGGSGHFVFARSSGATPHPEVVSTAAVSDGGFHHLAAVREGTTLKLYVDGEAQGQATDTVTSTIRGTASLYVGSRAGGSHFFEGTVSELRLWRRARTAEEIGAAMAS
ncbi:MAG: LamG domain-containing protein, partial [Bosea sp.]|uniref:LamG domain-containing protein n=1 Tax=Bosea sp. (in: a-proteobacteria) TaxID=1871050 RepID=UPI0031FE71B7|nr:LamG domain-containing protein [Bosea sp. (in: a-proteobacteria)]